jgi:hypothetical protein
MKRQIVVAVLLGLAPAALAAQGETGPKFELFGFVMTDVGYDFNQVDPAWYDVVRPTKLPTSKNQFGADGNAYFGVRQTRFGVKASTPTGIGELKTHFEFELFGTGVDAGQTTFRLRHAYGEIGQFGAGQTWSPFMDIDVFPNSLEYWGPSGMVFFRNVQVRWMPIRGDSRLTVALERPGASGDQGVYRDRIELQDVKPRFAAPDLSAEYRYGRKWGYLELAGIVRSIKWADVGTDQFDLGGSATGWGVNFSTNLRLRGAGDVIRAQLVYGEGIENYMNDAPADIGIENVTGNPTRPIKGVALPVIGGVAFLDHTWNSRFTTALGYSNIDIRNTDGQANDAFHRGQYALGNVLFNLAPGVTTGVEFQWGSRQSFVDGYKPNDYRLQFSFKYAFSKTIGEQTKTVGGQ